MAKFDLIELRQKRSLWKEVNIDALPEDNREIYIKRKNAVDLYIDGIPLKKVVEKTGIVDTEVIRFVHKCLSSGKNDEAMGYTALIPNKRHVKSISKLEKLFLQYPSLEHFVRGNYFGDKKYTLEHNINVRTLHAKFVVECKRIGIQNYEYPFVLKDKGYNSLYQYIKQVEATNQNATIKRHDRNAQQKFETTGYGESFSLTSLFPYGVVQIDGHKIDMIYSVETENKDGELIREPASRAWAIVLIDTATRVIIGYAVSPHENYDQYDVLMAVHNAIVPHKMIRFSRSGLRYPKNGGFPSTALPEMNWASFDMLMLDNAKAHLAQNAMQKMIHGIKCSVNFGSVATPETRGIIERFFETLETGGFHRLPGTTGSNPKDTKKKNPEYESVKYGITYEDICELMEYLIAEYNNSAHEALENETPLQVLERRVRQAGMQPYIIPPEERNNVEKLTYFTVERTLRGNYHTGSRPLVSYLGTKYHATNANIPMDLIGQKVYLEVNPADVSHVDLYDSNGFYLANMVATGEWGKNPHSLKTHIAANRRKNKNKELNNSFIPDLTAYENDLRQNVKTSRRARTKVATIEREKGHQPFDSLGTEQNYYQGSKPIQKKETYTKEEIDLIDSMTIEEAYKKGLI